MRTSFISSLFLAAAFAVPVLAAPIESGLTQRDVQFAKRKNDSVSPLDDDKWLDKFAAGQVPDLTDAETQEAIRRLQAEMTKSKSSSVVQSRGIADVIEFMGKNMVPQANEKVSSSGKRAEGSFDKKEQMSRLLVAALLKDQGKDNSLERRFLSGLLGALGRIGPAIGEIVGQFGPDIISGLLGGGQQGGGVVSGVPSGPLPGANGAQGGLGDILGGVVGTAF